MPYDLYGNWYASEIDAINAETAQMNEIDNRRISADLAKVKKQLADLKREKDRKPQ